MDEQPSFDHELEQTVLNLGIPPCPDILQALSAEAKKDEQDLQYIEKLICADVALSAALIKTINSPFYGLRTKVHSIMQAIHILGLSHLSLVVTGMVMRDVLKGVSRFDMGRFWDVSSKIAIISSYLASRLPLFAYEHCSRQIDKDEAYTYGLFQDCGILVMLNYHPAYINTLGIANKSGDKKFTDVEDVEYVNNHAVIGYVLAKSWGLPEAMCQAIRFHHEHDTLEQEANFLTPESRDFIALALLAEKAVQLITGAGQTCEWDKGGQWVMAHFALSDADFESLVKGIRILNDEGNLNNI